MARELHSPQGARIQFWQYNAEFLMRSSIITQNVLMLYRKWSWLSVGSSILEKKNKAGSTLSASKM